MVGDSERNRVIRATLFGTAAQRYDPKLFKMLRTKLEELSTVAQSKLSTSKKCLTVGVNEPINATEKFDISLKLDW